MQVGIWKVKYSFCVCGKSESLLPKQKHREKNKTKDKSRCVRGERKVSICFLIVRRMLVWLLRIEHVNEYRNSIQQPIQKFKCDQNMKDTLGDVQESFRLQEASGDSRE